ncbi:MAG TPA: hypothetical protein VH592_12755 [Gemmataceae bacterium]
MFSPLLQEQFSRLPVYQPLADHGATPLLNTVRHARQTPQGILVRITHRQEEGPIDLTIGPRRDNSRSLQLASEELSHLGSTIGYVRSRDLRNALAWFTAGLTGVDSRQGHGKQKCPAYRPHLAAGDSTNS